MPPKILCGVTIIVVEDHDYFRSVLMEFLSGHGARVIGCGKVSEALEAVIRERPDLVLSDIALPDGDGFQLMRRLRDMDPEIGGNTATIAMSSLGATISNQCVLAAGFRSFLGKPFTPQQLLRTIQEALRPQS